MFKKIGLMFILCMGILGTTVFASSTDVSGYPYYVKFTQTQSSSIGSVFEVWSTTPLYFKDNKLVTFGSGTAYFKSDTGWVSTQDLTKDNIITADCVINSFSSGSIVEADGLPSVPLKAPTVQALGNLMTVFGANSMILSVVGVTVLALLLGVSLVPRLVHLFL